MHSVSTGKSLCKGPCSSDVYNPNFGLKGKNYDDSRIMFILHRSDSRAVAKTSSEHTLPFDYGEQNVDMTYWNALRRSDTGRATNWLLKSYCGLTWDDVYITNFFKCLLPADREPEYNEYRSCAKVMKRQIISAAPKKIVAFGYRTIEHMFPEFSKVKTLEPLVLTQHLYESVPLLISYHPRRIHDMKRAESQKHLKVIRDFILS
jgi:uracil-DNA glycosylase family 4